MLVNATIRGTSFVVGQMQLTHYRPARPVQHQQTTAHLLQLHGHVNRQLHGHLEVLLRPSLI